MNEMWVQSIDGMMTEGKTERSHEGVEEGPLFPQQIHDPNWDWASATFALSLKVKDSIVFCCDHGFAKIIRM
jgi:hypothetical protein